MRIRIAASLLLAAPPTACGPSSPAPADPTAGIGSHPVYDRCPETLELAQAGWCSAHLTAVACAYPEGTCTCVEPVNCGGAPYTGFWRLSCDPADPPPPRPGDCPAAQPEAGSPCQVDVPECVWGECVWNRTVGRCEGGTWTIEYSDVPPPG